ncbi:hypothetical protein B0J11DRAFT_436855, partial [Dendryphion nanum]
LDHYWIDPKLTCYILGNGLEISVTQSLASALHALRHRNTRRIIWTDAVCIDQSNLTEKSFQVPMMA